jgi:hypothetical protein
MELTVRFLKKVLKDLDDDIILGDLRWFNDEFKPFNNIKRLLVLEREATSREQDKGQKYLVINNQGSHFTGTGDQEGLKYTGVHFDENTKFE